MRGALGTHASRRQTCCSWTPNFFLSGAAAETYDVLASINDAQVQVFDAEVACYQCLLTAVHSSIKLVTSAIKGFEPVTGEFQELVRQLSSNEVGGWGGDGWGSPSSVDTPRGSEGAAAEREA